MAKMAKERGYLVTVISGPTGLKKPAGVTTIDVETAAQMEQAVSRTFPQMDALIMGAAVADFRPIRVATQKIKRSGVSGSLRLWQLELVENPDIVAEAARARKSTQVIVGFALETERLIPNARAKLTLKGLDAIVATKLTPRKNECGPFGNAPADGAILRTGHVMRFRNLAKIKLASRILDTMETCLASRRSSSASRTKS